MHPKTKILVASALVLALGAAASLSGASPALLARIALGAAAVAGAAWWWRKARQAGAPGAEQPRLAVVARSGLSPRTALALVEVGGRTMLVVHGEGFAEIHPLGRSRRPPQKRKAFAAALRSVS